MIIYTFGGYNNNTADIVQACLRNYYGSVDKTITLCYKENGAPYILNADEKISISHSQNYFVLAISNQNVGVDIECIKERAFESIARKFLDDDITDLRQFYSEWAKLESQYKHGGMDGAFRSFEVFEDSILTVYSADQDIIFIPYESFKEEKE